MTCLNSKGKFPFLRLLPTFAGVLGEKIRTRASLKKALTNYTLKESLIHTVYDKNIIYAIFLFREYQELVRRETTEDTSIEFIGYRISLHEQNQLHSLIHKASINKSVSGFPDILIGCLDIRI